MLELKNLSVNVAEKQILKNFSFEFQKDTIYAIMGPNGSGKSTLAYSMIGHPGYEITEGSIEMNGENLNELDANERSQRGLFLSFQTPLSLSGVKVHQLLQLALSGKKDPLQIRQEMQKYAKELGISDELLNRSLNDGASGGEKKKLEALQAAVLDKEIQIFDEVDTGVDVDSLKSISTFLNAHRNGKTYIIITHYNRILEYLKPDKVLIVANGELKKVGGASLAEMVEQNGYESFI